MAWGKDNDQGPWGRPPGGGGLGGGNGGGGDKRPPEPPDFDALLKKGQDQFRQMFGGGGGGTPGGKKGFLVFFGLLGVLWLGSGIYLVKADELGIITRFGQYDRATPPGIGYHLPFPIEKVATPKVTTVNRVEIGFRSAYGRTSRAENAVPEESLMLTGDENIVDINFEVQWKIAKAEDFLFNVRAPEETVKAVAESSMREVIGKSEIATVLAEGKLAVEQSTKKLIQDTLNSYKAGVEVVTVNLLKVDPPAQVIDAFRDVQTARADLETSRNQAEAYRNDIIPRARGDAQKMVLDAEGYKQEVVAKARGEASRFASVYGEYKQAKDVTKKRMYLETMEEILPGMNKVIVDNKNGVIPYLPLSELKPAAKAEEKQ